MTTISDPHSPFTYSYGYIDFEGLAVFKDKDFVEGEPTRPLLDTRCTELFKNTIGSVAEVGGSSMVQPIDGASFAADHQFGSGNGHEPASKKIRLGTSLPQESGLGVAAPLMGPPRAGEAASLMVPAKPGVGIGALPSAFSKILPPACPSVQATEIVFKDWQPKQIDRLDNVTSPQTLFNLYFEVYPAQEKEIKKFIAHVFYQFYLIKTRKFAPRVMDWDSLIKIVRDSCDFKFPVFVSYLQNKGYLIVCLFTHLHKYKPGKAELFLSELESTERKVPNAFICFFNILVKVFGDDLALLTEEI